MGDEIRFEPGLSPPGSSRHVKPGSSTLPDEFERSSSEDTEGPDAPELDSFESGDLLQSAQSLEKLQKARQKFQVKSSFFFAYRDI